MAFWRMAFREGINGKDIWPECEKRGIAAIGYRIFGNRNFSTISESEFDEICRDVSASASVRASLRKLVYRMENGDTIYVKRGPQIVGKGKIIEKYQYNPSILKPLTWWPHFVRVDWEKNFPILDIVLGADLHTILELKDERLRKIKDAELKVIHK